MMSQFILHIQIYGYTSLHIACLFDQQRVVGELLRRVGDGGSPINEQDNVSSMSLLLLLLTARYYTVLCTYSWGGLPYTMLLGMETLTYARR